MVLGFDVLRGKGMKVFLGAFIYICEGRVMPYGLQEPKIEKKGRY